MKKQLLIILAITAFSCSISLNTKAQLIQKGKMIVDVYYGYPNLFTAAMKTAYNNSITESVKVSGIGPIGGKFEYLLSDKIGLALNINYANSSVKGSGVGSDNVTVYNYKVTIPRFRVFPIINVHYATSEQLDPYFLVGAGYGNFTTKLESNDPNFTEESVSGLGHFSMRVGTGLRYFFTDNIGAHLEFGIGGGGLFQIGVSGKF